MESRKAKVMTAMNTLRSGDEPLSPTVCPANPATQLTSPSTSTATCSGTSVRESAFMSYLNSLPSI